MKPQRQNPHPKIPGPKCATCAGTGVFWTSHGWAHGCPDCLRKVTVTKMVEVKPEPSAPPTEAKRPPLNPRVTLLSDLPKYEPPLPRRPRPGRKPGP